MPRDPNSDRTAALAAGAGPIANVLHMDLHRVAMARAPAPDRAGLPSSARAERTTPWPAQPERRTADSLWEAHTLAEVQGFDQLLDLKDQRAALLEAFDRGYAKGLQDQQEVNDKGYWWLGLAFGGAVGSALMWASLRFGWAVGS